jgi:hypothetical protein
MVIPSPFADAGQGSIHFHITLKEYEPTQKYHQSSSYAGYCYTIPSEVFNRISFGGSLIGDLLRVLLYTKIQPFKVEGLESE